MTGSIAAGHPEIEYPGTSLAFASCSASSLVLWNFDTSHTGIEVTTGPLGQGISNAVGMAIASKQLAATYNREGLKVVDNKIWCFTGDGCLQEGVGQEGRYPSDIYTDRSQLLRYYLLSACSRVYCWSPRLGFINLDLR